MLEAKAERTIAAPPAQARGAMVAWQSYPEWMPDIQAVEPLDGTPAGPRFRLVAVERGKRIVSTMELTEHADRLEAHIVRDGGGEAWATWRFHPAGAGTRVEYTMSLKLPGVARLFAPMIRGAVRKSLESVLEALDRRVGGAQ